MVFSNTWWKKSRSDALVEWVGDDVLRVTVTRPAFKWTPGQHASVEILAKAALTPR